jgi:hypothetical protein
MVAPAKVIKRTAHRQDYSILVEKAKERATGAVTGSFGYFNFL